MEVSGPVVAQANLPPGEGPLVLTEREAGWAPE